MKFQPNSKMIEPYGERKKIQFEEKKSTKKSLSRKIWKQIISSSSQELLIAVGHAEIRISTNLE